VRELARIAPERRIQRIDLVAFSRPEIRAHLRSQGEFGKSLAQQWPPAGSVALESLSGLPAMLPLLRRLDDSRGGQSLPEKAVEWIGCLVGEMLLAGVERVGHISKTEQADLAQRLGDSLARVSVAVFLAGRDGGSSRLPPTLPPSGAPFGHELLEKVFDAPDSPECHWKGREGREEWLKCVTASGLLFPEGGGWRFVNEAVFHYFVARGLCETDTRAGASVPCLGDPSLGELPRLYRELRVLGGLSPEALSGESVPWLDDVFARGHLLRGELGDALPGCGLSVPSDDPVAAAPAWEPYRRDLLRVCPPGEVSGASASAGGDWIALACLGDLKALDRSYQGRSGHQGVAVRRAVCEAMRHAPPAESFVWVQESYPKETRSEVRVAMIRALAAGEDPAAAEWIAEQLNGGDGLPGSGGDDLPAEERAELLGALVRIHPEAEQRVGDLRKRNADLLEGFVGGAVPAPEPEEWIFERALIEAISSLAGPTNGFTEWLHERFDRARHPGARSCFLEALAALPDPESAKRVWQDLAAEDRSLDHLVRFCLNRSNPVLVQTFFEETRKESSYDGGGSAADDFHRDLLEVAAGARDASDWLEETERREHSPEQRGRAILAVSRSPAFAPMGFLRRLRNKPYLEHTEKLLRAFLVAQPLDAPVREEDLKNVRACCGSGALSASGGAVEAAEVLARWGGPDDLARLCKLWRSDGAGSPAWLLDAIYRLSLRCGQSVSSRDLGLAGKGRRLLRAKGGKRFVFFRG